MPHQRDLVFRSSLFVCLPLWNWNDMHCQEVLDAVPLCEYLMRHIALNVDLVFPFRKNHIEKKSFTHFINLAKNFWDLK